MKCKSVVIGIALSAVAALPVSAQDTPCSADAEQFCAGVEPGAGQIGNCLREHDAELSEACQQYLQQSRERLTIFLQACSNDIKSHCADIKGGGGRLFSCLQENSAQLSTECQSQLDAVESAGDAS